jgi:tetratricopeptide (TPR) repeat protein
MLFKQNEMKITDTDREWVNDNFKYLIDIFGYPLSEFEQLELTDQYFPLLFSTENIELANLIEDLRGLLTLDGVKIKFEIRDNIRSLNDVRYLVDNKLFESDLIFLDDGYKIVVSKDLLANTPRLVYAFIIEFIRIRLIESGIEEELDEEDDSFLFNFIAGVYFRFGLILSQNLTVLKSSLIDSKVVKRAYNSDMPLEVMIYTLGLYSVMINDTKPKWMEGFDKECNLDFKAVINFIEKNEDGLIKSRELEANNLHVDSDEAFKSGDFEKAIEILHKVLFLTEDDYLKSTAFNNIGYYYSRSHKYEKSILNLKKAIALEPYNGYAYDNLGFCHIQLGELEQGKACLDKALKLDDSDLSYSYRNLALYHFYKEELDEAGSNFKKSFDNMDGSVDLLEYFYAKYLLAIKDEVNAMKYLKLAVKKGETEAIELWSELNW